MDIILNSVMYTMFISFVVLMYVRFAKWIINELKYITHGIRKQYYKTGELMLIGQWHNKKRHGMFKYYYKNGKLKHETPYLYGEKVSKEEYREHELIEMLSGI